MANQFHTGNKWVENLQLAYVQVTNYATGNSREKLCHTTKSFWLGDIKRLTGAYPGVDAQPVAPEASAESQKENTKPSFLDKAIGGLCTVLDAANAILSIFTEDGTRKKLADYPRLELTTGETYYIDSEEEYRRLMSIIKGEDTATKEE